MDDKKLFIKYFFVGLTLKITDSVLTYYAVSFDLAREGNPFYNMLMNNFGFLVASLISVTLYTLWVRWAFMVVKYRMILIKFMCLALFACVIWNSAIILVSI